MLLEMACADLPNLQHLSIEDITAIRRSDDAFENWRKVLRTGLTQSRLKDGETSPSLLNEYMEEAKQSLETEIQKSSLLSATKTAFWSFGVGALSGSLTGSITAAIIGSGVSAGTKLLEDRLWAKSTKPDELALSHVVSFLKPSS